MNVVVFLLSGGCSFIVVLRLFHVPPENLQLPAYQIAPYCDGLPTQTIRQPDFVDVLPSQVALLSW